MKRNKFVYFSAILSLLVLTTGCSTEQENSHTTEQESSHNHQTTAHGDIREETKSIETLPSFLNDKDENINLVYSQAAEHEELLEFIPCYCGCGDSVGHKNNFDCFVHKKTDEEIIWDDHGTKCQACLEIAAESIIMYEKGESIKNIRNYIDKNYSEGYAKPTPTPMPA
ncbi:PCYCGC motif-containing (lipo)protein [Bacillus seohaeanensis]|jgi:hypothetical protein|uniref:PCYCGC motif-containing (Lipo)protein n=1 Tax=Bacillus seohaeanensis TaxID=284580 RepID=A0ABW5RR45_9BACI